MGTLARIGAGLILIGLGIVCITYLQGWNVALTSLRIPVYGPHLGVCLLLVGGFTVVTGLKQLPGAAPTFTLRPRALSTQNRAPPCRR